MEQAEDASEKTRMLKTGAGYEPNSANNGDTVIIFPLVIPTHQLTVTDDGPGW